MANSQGKLILLLHAHLPFVRHPEHEDFLEEDWLFEAMTETYIPVIDALERLSQEGVDFRLSMSVSPCLCEMLADPLLQSRFARRLDNLRAFCQAELDRTSSNPDLFRTAKMNSQALERAHQLYNDAWGRDLIAAFRRLQDAGVLEIPTCAATHGMLPLFSHPKAVRAQLSQAVRNYEKHFRRKPSGIWLPECAYVDGLDDELARVGLKYFFLDSHGVLYGTPRPQNGVHAPIMCPGRIAAFARDPECSAQVWSNEEGYPGDPAYREFYRDAGYDSEFEHVKGCLHADGVRRNIGIKYHRVTGKDVPLHEKEAYDPALASERAAEHAADFLVRREEQVEFLGETLGQAPVITAPYDAELFGHWWYEGPLFLENFLRQASKSRILRLETPTTCLAKTEDLQTVTPAASSWGDKGYFEVWINSSNDWIYRHLHRAESRMVEMAAANRGATGLLERALNQAARELMLLQSSDWAFIMATGTMVEYAEKRTRDHLDRFTRLYQMVDNGAIDEAALQEMESRDSIFPEINFRIYCE